MKEGQSHMGIELYEALANHFWDEGQVEFAFTNSWSWNLMCRTMNVQSLGLGALTWEQDAIGVEFGKTKTSKGVKVMTKHVYCNPYKPWVLLIA